MNKTQLVAAVAEKVEVTKVDAGKCVEAVIEAITEALKSGDDVALQGFGTFSVAETKERQGVNPQTKEAITIAAGKKPKFKAGKALKDAVK